MGTQRWWLMGLGALLFAWSPMWAADPPVSEKEARDVQALAARIDQYLTARWTEAKAKPATPADDAEFLRRVYLDLGGRIPSVAEARAFFEDKAPDKRRRLIDKLLASNRYVVHFTNVWRALMLPEASASLQARFLAPGFEAWLRKELSRNAGYDQMARELLTTPVGPEGMQRGFGGGNGPNPAAFYLAKELKAENLAAGTSRLFLGVKLECAQCHNHPFATWKREQFWSYAAFFAGMTRQMQGDFVAPGREIADKRELTIPGTDRVVQAKFLDGKEPVWKPKISARGTLAEWMTSKENPYFARATVNRMWGYFFGTGLIDPVDDMIGGEHTASHPELLDELAHQFTAHHFDLKFVIRVVTATKAYQLSSLRTYSSQDDPRLFARMAVKGLTAEQLFDSVAEATGYQEGPTAPNPFVLAANSPRTEFVTKFTNQSDKVTEVQTSILQALSLMNGRLVADATSLERSETLAGCSTRRSSTRAAALKHSTWRHSRANPGRRRSIA